ncbi:hypothetical protein STRCI_007999 [Streptomyces cinnabarinus]|uniref:Uncharacterized protein n=1 Tax=Streptomyces cinnabarinus TaxID=67287 RepID=A0ABY7KQ07_9ACTN|nr:hypothetical protein [Streptomyces cinnabarinus]WAZ26424.1 hypothetical protein STRCI_007999 [Streptomyces cinnabarinus]
MGKTAVLEQAQRAAAQDGAAVVRLGWEDEDSEDTADAFALDAGCGLTVEDPDGCLPPLTAARRAQLRAAVREGWASALSAFSEVLMEAFRQTRSRWLSTASSGCRSAAPMLWRCCCGSSAREAYPR